MRIVALILSFALVGCQTTWQSTNAPVVLEESIQMRAPFSQDPSKIDLPQEAIERARSIVFAEEGSHARHTFEFVHDFWSPFSLTEFAPKGGRVFIVRVGGYDTKDAQGAISRFLWLNEDGKGMWEL